MTEKTSLRASCLSKRAAIASSDHSTWSFAACERLAALLSKRSLNGFSVALYNPIRGELDVTPVLHALYAEGVTVALPVVEPGQGFLSFYRFHSALSLIQGAFGVLEPEHQERVTPDIVVMPLVGFDRKGNRIGYGKGYYDWTLAELRRDNKSLMAIGMAFSVQEVPEFPLEGHDMPLDGIVTEKETLAF